MPEVRTLADACSDIVDCAHKTAPIDDAGEYFAVGTPAMRGHKIDYAEARRISRATFEEWTQRLRPKAGDLLLAREAPVGPIVAVPDSENVAPGQRTVLLRPRAGVVDGRFLYYYLTSPSIQAALQVKASGSTVPHLNVADVRSMPTPGIPSIKEQRGIAQLLGALDDKIAANDRVDDVATELGKALFRRALDNRGIDRISLGELVSKGVISLGDGYRTKRTEHAAQGFRIVRAGDVAGGRLNLTGPDFVSAQFERKIGQKAVRAGDVVLTTKGSVGRVAVIPWEIEHAVYSPQLCYFRVVDAAELDPGYLAAWFMSDDLQRQAESRMFKTDMAPYINLQDIRSLEIPYPAADVRATIGQRQAAFQQHIHGRQFESRALAAMRDELLPLLMSGKVRVRDAAKVVEGVA